ncbi:retinoic acid early transcript 1E-like [Rhynchonycteris naso]
MTAPSKFSGVFLCLLLLLSCVRAAPRHAHSLCLNLTVLSQSGPRQPLYQAQGSLDKKPFLQYDSNTNRVRPLGPLREKLNGTNALKEIPQMLEEIGQELRMILPNIKLETCTRERKAGQYTGASWEFSFNGQPALLLDTMHKKWTVIDPAASGTKEDLAENKELAEYFRKISVGDCNQWLMEFLEHMEKVQQPTELSNPQGPLAEKVNATNPWTELPQTQGERAREHRMNLSDISLEKNRTRGMST